MQFATIVVVVRSIQVLAKDAQRLEFTRRLREELMRSGREASPVTLAREINLHLRASERVHASSCRKWLFAEDTNRDKAERILGSRLIPVETIADKTLWTDRPLEHP